MLANDGFVPIGPAELSGKPGTWYERDLTGGLLRASSVSCLVGGRRDVSRLRIGVARFRSLDGSGGHHARASVSDLGLQAGGELGHDVRRRLGLPRERDALSGPHRERFDLPGRTDHRRRRLVPDDCLAGGEVRDHVAVSWPLVVWGAARGFPRPGR